MKMNTGYGRFIEEDLARDSTKESIKKLLKMYRVDGGEIRKANDGDIDLIVHNIFAEQDKKDRKRNGEVLNNA